MTFSSRILALVASLVATFAMMAYPVLALALSGLVLLSLAIGRAAPAAVAVLRRRVHA